MQEYCSHSHSRSHSRSRSHSHSRNRNRKSYLFERCPLSRLSSCTEEYLRPSFHPPDSLVNDLGSSGDFTSGITMSISKRFQAGALQQQNYPVINHLLLCSSAREFCKAQKESALPRGLITVSRIRIDLHSIPKKYISGYQIIPRFNL